jgi:hypothetical protein
MARFKGRINADLVVAVGQRLQLPLGQAESPRLAVVRSAIGDPVRCLRQAEQMLLQLRQPHPPANRHTVVQHVQVGLCEVHHFPALRVLDPCIADVPFLGNRPIQNLRACRDLMQLDGNLLLQEAQALAEAVARDAAADRVKRGDELMQLSPVTGCIPVLQNFSEWLRCRGRHIQSIRKWPSEISPAPDSESSCRTSVAFGKNQMRGGSGLGTRPDVAFL